MKKEYKEIIELYNYCRKIGIEAKLETCWDGYAIRFPSGDDFVQHAHSYGSEFGCVEPAIRSRSDYSPVTLKKAKSLVRYHRIKLNTI